MEETYFHSVRLNKDKCTGCTNCIKRCPTEAIRVQDGKAKILEQRCIDCGNCIRVCPHHAKNAFTDPITILDKFKYTIALPAPALYGQFKGASDADVLLQGLKKLGFDEVYEVAKGAEIVSEAVAEKLKSTVMKPLISSACPAVVRLIQVRFPELLDNVVDVDAPAEVAAKIAKEEFAKKHNVEKEDIGAIFITPCPAKMTGIKSPLAKYKSDIDGAVSILDIYGLLSSQIGKPSGEEEEEDESEREERIKREASAIGVGWALSGGEVNAVGERNALAVDGIGNVIRALEEIEDGKLTDIDFFEGLACAGGCIGGPLVFESPYVAEMRVVKLCDHIWKNKGVSESAADYVARGVANVDKSLEAKDVMKLDDNRVVAMQKINKIEELVEKLPGMDCGSCGSPSCRALAEDIVRGHANELDCIFVLKEKVKFLAEEMVGLANMTKEKGKEHQ